MPKTDLKHLIYLVKIISSNETLFSLLIAVGLVMVLPPYLLLAYPSEEVIKAFEYTRYAPLLFLFLLSIISIRMLKYVLNIIIKYLTDKYRDHRFERKRKNYLMNLNNYELKIIANLYNSKKYGREHCGDLYNNDQQTSEFRDFGIIEYIRDEDEYTEVYSLADWVVDIIENYNEFNKRIMRIIKENPATN